MRYATLPLSASLFVVLLLSTAVFTTPADAQSAADTDTLRTYELESIVVTADRSARLLSSSTSAVSLLQAEELQRMPLNTFADALEMMPGFAFLSLDGLGFESQATVRGFYGGGEAEYVVMLIDGRPINGLERGLINWNLLPLDNIKSVEAVRGGVSSLYGDAAIGGVVNVITTAGSAVPSTRIVLRGGAYETLNGHLSHSGLIGARRYAVHGGLERTDGFRDHAERQFGNVGASFDLARADGRVLTLSTRHHWRSFDVPGPLSTGGLAEGRETSSALYSFDNTEERFHQASLDGSVELAPATRLTGALTGEFRQSDAVITLELAPGFGDTQNRDLSTGRALGTVQLTTALPISVGNTFTTGIDASLGSLDNKYYSFLMGSAEDYEAAGSVERGDQVSQGEATRKTFAAYAQYDINPVPRLRLSVGARYDAIDDSFTPQAPSTGEELSKTHSAFSPKAGVNVRYASSPRHVGNLYANVSKSFKTPTLDQLYDQRAIPIPFPPFQISLSSSELKPQRGSGFEVGLYHRTELVPGRLTGELSVAVYQMDMRNELDFSLETLTYTNLGKSRHKGLETGLKLYGPRGVSAFVNYTYQGVTLEFGENDGNYVKAIPRDVVTAGVSAAHRSGLGGSLRVKGSDRIYLDDANTIPLSGYTTVDARAFYRIRDYTVALNVFNLFDKAYSTTGFPLADFVGGQELFFYPAAGRQLQLGVTVDL